MPKKIKLGINFHILLIFAMGLLLSSFVITYILADHLREDMLKAATGSLNRQLGCLQEFVSSNPRVFTNPKERSVLKDHLEGHVVKMSGIEGLEDVFIVDDNYRVIVSTREEKIGTTYNNNDVRTAIKEDRKVMLQEAHMAEGKKSNFQDIAYPLHIRGRVVGAVHLQLPLAFIREEISHLHQHLLLITLPLIGLLVLTLFLFLRQFFIKPLQRIKNVTKKISQGNLEEIAPVGREDEIGELASSINTMTENLSHNIAEISLLYEIAQQVVSNPDFKKILEVLLENAIKTEGAESGAIILREKENGKGVVVMEKGFDREEGWLKEFENDGTAVRKVIEEGRPLLVDEDQLFIPLRLGEELLGVLALSNKCFHSCPVSCPTKTFKPEDLHFLDALANKALNVFYKEMKGARLSTIKALAAAVDAKDPYTRGHSQRVAQYADMIAQSLKFGSFEKENLQTAAYLHDIGKIGISQDILQKKEKLTDEEYNTVKAHSEISAQVLEKVNLPDEVILAVRYHHEHYDGKGYPRGLKGEEIPLGARILAVADAYDAMTSARPYRQALTFTSEEIELGKSLAQSELFKYSGTQFDPRVVQNFLRILAEESRLAKQGTKEKVVSLK